MAEDQEVSAPEVAVEVEQEARRFGWVPQEEFKGEPDEWKDAETFMKRGREINGYLRKDLEKITGQLKSKEAEILEMKKTMDEFKEFHRKTEERAYQRALEELRAQKKQAIELGDGEAVVTIDEKIDEVKEGLQTLKQPQPKTKSDDNQVILGQWLSQNPTFASDREVMAMANGLADFVKQENPSLVGIDFLNAVAERVKEALPHKFENTNRQRPPAVSSSTDAGTGRTGASKKKSYADLPAEAKAACDKFVKQGLLTQAEYVEQYFTGE